MTLAELRQWLQGLAQAEATIPARVVLERLPDTASPAPSADPLADLSAEEAGEVLGRSSSTVRAYARDGLLPGAYRQRGREWRIPRSAIRAFQTSEAKSEPRPPSSTRRADPETADLGAWRKVRDQRGAA